MKGLVFWILFVPFVCGLEVSPVEFDFVGGTGDVLCGEVVIDSVDGNVVVEDRWAARGYYGRDFLAHRLNGVDLGLDVRYEREFFVDGEVVKEICVSGREAGFYHGLLLIRGSEGKAGVGVWLSVDLVGLDLVDLSSGDYSNEFNRDLSNKGSGDFVLALLILLVVFLLVCLILLMS